MKFCILNFIVYKFVKRGMIILDREIAEIIMLINFNAYKTARGIKY